MLHLLGKGRDSKEEMQTFEKRGLIAGEGMEYERLLSICHGQTFRLGNDQVGKIISGTSCYGFPDV